MKHLLYIGNKLSNKHKTATTIDTLGGHFTEEGYKMSFASSYKPIVFRFLDMLYAVFIHRHKADYVLIDTYSTKNFFYAFGVSQLCRLFKLKYIPILHGGNLPYRLKRNPKLCDLVFNNAYINISPSNYIQHSFLEQGYNNIKVIPNSIPLTNYNFILRPLQPINLLWVRSFSELYNPKLAVDVLKELIDKGYDASLCMVGPDNDGSLERTKSYADKLQLPVTFTGKLTKTEWTKVAEDYNFFINTTNFDNMPVSVIEAMALGLPVVSTNVGGLPYLITHNVEGILVAPNNAQYFVNEIIRLSSSQELYKTLVANGRVKAEGFDWDKVKTLWLDVLKE